MGELREPGEGMAYRVEASCRAGIRHQMGTVYRVGIRPETRVVYSVGTLPEAGVVCSIGMLPGAGMMCDAGTGCNKLREAGTACTGLVAERREGRFAYYRAQPEALGPLVDWVDRYRSFWPERLEKLKTVLKDMEP